VSFTGSKLDGLSEWLLEDANGLLFESAAICLYLADLHDPAIQLRSR